MKCYNKSIENSLNEIERVHNFIEKIGEEHQIPAKIIFEINLAVDELLTNTISYGYTDNIKHIIEIKTTLNDNSFTISIIDDGKEFNPLQAKEVDTTLPLEERKIGGLGIHITKKVMDNITYLREDNKNIITLTKRINSEKEL